MIFGAHKQYAANMINKQFVMHLIPLINAFFDQNDSK